MIRRILEAIAEVELEPTEPFKKKKPAGWKPPPMIQVLFAHEQVELMSLEDKEALVGPAVPKSAAAGPMVKVRYTDEASLLDDIVTGNAVLDGVWDDDDRMVVWPRAGAPLDQFWAAVGGMVTMLNELDPHPAHPAEEMPPFEAIDEVELEPTEPFKKKPGKPGKLPPLVAVRQAIYEVLGERVADNVGAHASAGGDWFDAAKVKAAIVGSTFAGAEDPGEWAPGSYVVVHHEGGVPDAFDDDDCFQLWVDVGKRASELSGLPMYNESINPAVSAMWPLHPLTPEEKAKLGNP